MLLYLDRNVSTISSPGHRCLYVVRSGLCKDSFHCGTVFLCKSDEGREDISEDVIADFRESLTLILQFDKLADGSDLRHSISSRFDSIQLDARVVRATAPR